MPYYKVCTRCNARLDPSEKNDPCDECVEELKKEREVRECELIAAGEGKPYE